MDPECSKCSELLISSEFPSLMVGGFSVPVHDLNFLLSFSAWRYIELLYCMVVCFDGNSGIVERREKADPETDSLY